MKKAVVLFLLVTFIISVSLNASAMRLSFSGAKKTHTTRTLNSDGKKAVISYFGLFWARDQKKIDSMPFDKMTHLLIAFGHAYKDAGDNGYKLKFERNTELDPKEQEAAFLRVVKRARAVNPDIKILISQGYGDGEYQKCLSTPEVFAKSVAAFISKYKIDGYDMNIEQENVNVDSFVKFFDTLRNESSMKGKILTYTPYATNASSDTKCRKAIVRDVDMILAQTYGPEKADEKFFSWYPKNKVVAGWESENTTKNTKYSSIEKLCTHVKNSQLAGVFTWGLNAKDRGPQDISDIWGALSGGEAQSLSSKHSSGHTSGRARTIHFK